MKRDVFMYFAPTYRRDSQQGFTLMELLIVIAIIGVLVAICIPVFTGLLAKSRAAADAAMIRSGYSQAMAAVLDDSILSKKTYYLKTDGSVSSSTEDLYTCVGSYENFTNPAEKIGMTLISSIAWNKGDKIIYSYDPNNQSITISTQLSAEEISAKNVTSVKDAVVLAISAWKDENGDNVKNTKGVICTYTVATGETTVEVSSTSGVSGIFTKASDLEGYLTTGSMTRKDGTVYTVRETNTHENIKLNESVVKTWTIYVSIGISSGSTYGKILGYSATI